MASPTVDLRSKFGWGQSKFGQRFVTAQEDTYEQALAEIKAGKKKTHCIWFIFPQLRGLGHSEISRYYGLAGLEEAKAYLDHENLGLRLITIANATLSLSDITARDIFGHPDDRKLQSSATLFAQVAGGDSVFHCILTKYFEGQKDQKSLLR